MQMKKTVSVDFFLITAMVMAGIALRAAFALCIPNEPIYDFATYLELARNIKNGLGHTLNGMPVAWQGPLYPYALGTFFRIADTESEMAAKIFNIILSSLTLAASVPVYRLMLPGRRSRLAAVAIMAFFPANIAYVNVIGTEVLFTLLLLLIILLLLYNRNARGSASAADCVIIGALTGLAALTKPFMLAFPAVLALLFWLQTKNPRRTVLLTVIVTTVAIATVTPWTIRNWRTFGHFIPVSYNAGYVRYINNNDRNVNGLWMDLEAAAADKPEAAGISVHLAFAGEAGVKAAYGLEPVLNEAARKWIRDNPFGYIKLGFLRVYETFFGEADDVPQWAMNRAEFKSERDRNSVEAALDIVHNALSLLSFLLLFMLLASFVRDLRVSREACIPDMVFLIIFAFVAAVVFYSEGQPRYAFPVYPLMIYAAVRLNCSYVTTIRKN